VEALLVVGIVGILATMATYGVSKYLALAKSAEAIQLLGVIGRAVSISSDRLQAEGSQRTSGPPLPVLCGDSIAVPNAFTPVRQRAYQPDPSPGMDYNSGDRTTGWKCLGFEHTSTQHYQYRYRLGGPPIAVPGFEVPPPGVPPDRLWAAYARGDIDGDGVFSWFVVGGYAEEGRVVTATRVAILDQEE
jgi:hypothetical protein